MPYTLQRNAAAMKTTRTFSLAMVLLASILLTLMGARYIEAGKSVVDHPPSADFYKFYLSGERLQRGQSMYWVIPPKIRPGDPCHPDAVREKGQPTGESADALTLGGAIPCLAPNLNPPFFMVFMGPLAMLDFHWSWWLWSAMSMGCLVMSTWLMAGEIAPSSLRRTALTIIGTALLMAYHPVYINFALGQVGTLLLLPLTLAWLKMRRGDEKQAGLWLGLATGLKPFLALFLLPLLLTKRWQASAAMIANLLMTLMVGWLCFGTEPYAHYRLVADQVTWTTSNWNGSLIGFTDRAFSGIDPRSWPNVKMISRAIGLSLCAAVIAAMCVKLRQSASGKSTRGSDTADQLFLLTIPAAVLVSPLGWLYYMPWMCLCGLIVWQRTANAPHARAWRLAFIASVIATVAPIEMKSIPTPRNPTEWWGIDALYCYALAGMFVVLLKLPGSADQKLRT